MLNVISSMNMITVSNGTSPKLLISYPDKIKVITQLKSVDAHMLIGNIGGYIGLFLGNSDNHTCEKPFAIYES